MKRNLPTGRLAKIRGYGKKLKIFRHFWVTILGKQKMTTIIRVFQ